jgi:hypothetical protein
MPRLAVAAAVLVVALGIASNAPAATPTQATSRIAACLTKAGAIKVVRRGGGVKGATAYFKKPNSIFTDVWVSWNYTIVNGQVASVQTASAHLAAVNRRAANRCLKPYGGRV